MTPAARRRACRSGGGPAAARAAAPSAVGEESARDSAWRGRAAFAVRGRVRGLDGGRSEAI